MDLDERIRSYCPILEYPDTNPKQPEEASTPEASGIDSTSNLESPNGSDQSRLTATPVASAVQLQGLKPAAASAASHQSNAASTSELAATAAAAAPVCSPNGPDHPLDSTGTDVASSQTDTLPKKGILKKKKPQGEATRPRAPAKSPAIEEGDLDRIPDDLDIMADATDMEILEAKRRKAAFKSMLILLERDASTEAELLKLCAPLSGDEMIHVAEERALAGKCGSPICPRPFKWIGPSARYLLLHSAAANGSEEEGAGISGYSF
eukprot:gene18305-24765_t